MEELNKTESENRDLFLEKLTENFSENKDYNACLIGKEIPVPYRHIYFPVQNELEICCFKQDICIYQILFDKSIKHKEAQITSVAGDKILTVVLNKNAQKKQDIGLPFVTIETKMSGMKNTNELLSCSEKIKMIKTIFPYCKSYLLCFGNLNRNVYRLCSGFDEIFFLENFKDEETARIIKTILSGFDYAYYNMMATA